MKKCIIEKEAWKDIKGYEECYQVSNLGRVRSLDRTVESFNQFGNCVKQYKGRVLKTSLRKEYPRVILSKNNHSNHQSVHRLVATHFIENAKNLEQVNHIDCDKTNNRVDNLEWVSHLQNAQHAVRSGCYNRGSAHSQSRIDSEHVPDILNLYFVDGLYQEDIGSKYDVSQSVISRIIRGESWHFSESPNLIELRSSLL